MATLASKHFYRPIVWSYGLLGALLSASVYLAGLLLPNWSNVTLIIQTSGWASGLEMAFSIVLAPQFTYTSVALLGLIIAALLSASNIILLAVYIRIRQSVRSTATATTIAPVGLLGLFASFIGLGCAACGGVVLLTLLKLLGATFLLTYLPLHGNEFVLLGIGLLGWSNWYLYKKVFAPKTC
jgi:hypothetical protein